MYATLPYCEILEVSNLLCAIDFIEKMGLHSQLKTKQHEQPIPKEHILSLHGSNIPSGMFMIIGLSGGTWTITVGFHRYFTYVLKCFGFHSETWRI